ncbi:MAG: 1,4-dihydroxy-2-naphthoate octaprenyltransferase [Candidatus Omnitrophota bacterium]
MTIKPWLKAIRAPFFTATIIPVILGSVIAWHDTGSFAWIRFWLTMIGILLIHTGTNLANDYFDHLSGCDKANTTPTPFSGGSRVIQEGLIAPKKILYASLASFILGSVIGIYLNYLCKGNLVFILGLAGVFLGFFYTAKPFHIGYGSLGELAVGAGFGPLVVMGSYYVQTETLSPRIFFISIPIGILIALVLFINEFPDYSADRSVGKKTLVVSLGKKRAIVLYQALLTSVYFITVSLIIFRFLPAMSLIVFFSAPLAIKALVVSGKNFDKVYELLPANALTIGLHSLIGLLLSAGILLDRVLCT